MEHKSYTCTKLVVEGNTAVGRLNKTWQNAWFASMRPLGVDPWDVQGSQRLTQQFLERCTLN